MTEEYRLDRPVAVTCPECGGALWELRDGALVRFQCHVGHAFNGESLVAAQSESLEAALWTALRALEESSSLRQRMAHHARGRGMSAIAATYAQEAPKAPKSIKEVMANHKPKELRAQIGEGLKSASPDWADLQKKSKTYAEAVAKLSDFDPPKGDKENFKKLAKEFGDGVKAMDKAIVAKDAKGANEAFAKSGMACGACHRAHKP